MLWHLFSKIKGPGWFVALYWKSKSLVAILIGWLGVAMYGKWGERDVISFCEIGEPSLKGMMEGICKRFRKKNYEVWERLGVEEMVEKSISESNLYW
jgi:hypothetical protein